MDLLVQRDPGPWGAQCGRHWDDGVFLAIKQVFVLTGSEYAIMYPFKNYKILQFAEPKKKLDPNMGIM